MYAPMEHEKVALRENQNCKATFENQNVLKNKIIEPQLMHLSRTWTVHGILVLCFENKLLIFTKQMYEPFRQRFEPESKICETLQQFKTPSSPQLSMVVEAKAGTPTFNANTRQNIILN